MPARPQKGPRYRVLRGLDLANGRRFEADAVLPDKVPYSSPAVRLFAGLP